MLHDLRAAWARAAPHLVPRARALQRRAKIGRIGVQELRESAASAARHEGYAMKTLRVCEWFVAMLALSPVHAQEPVVGVADPESLFKSPDPKLNANKQVVYGIFRDLLEANHWELADKYLTERYIQHNPNAAS